MTTHAELVQLDPADWGAGSGRSEPSLRSESRASAARQGDAGEPWWELVSLGRCSDTEIHSSITFAFVATHNHFVLDRGGKVFNQLRTGDQSCRKGRRRMTIWRCWAPELIDGMLLAQAGQPRQGGMAAIGGGIGAARDVVPRYRVHWHHTAGLSTARSTSAGRGRELDRLARELSSHDPSAVVARRRQPQQALAAREYASE